MTEPNFTVFCIFVFCFQVGKSLVSNKFSWFGKAIITEVATFKQRYLLELPDH